MGQACFPKIPGAFSPVLGLPLCSLLISASNFQEYGFRIKDTPKGKAVTAKTDPRQEGLAYPDFPPYIEATEILTKHCMAGILPIHAIFGAKNDFV
jgi:hypothetical protein